MQYCVSQFSLIYNSPDKYGDYFDTYEQALGYARAKSKETDDIFVISDDEDQRLAFVVEGKTYLPE